MKFRRPTTGQRSALQLDITALVDVVFLLIIFLLVTTTFRKKDHAFNIRLPQAGTESIIVETQVPILLVNQDGFMAFLDPEVQQKDTEFVPKEALKTQLEVYIANHPDISLRVRAEQKASYQNVIKAISIAHEAGAQNVQLEYEQATEPAKPTEP